MYQIYDLGLGMTINTGVALATELAPDELSQIRGRLLAFVGSETRHGSDLNGDGDAADNVLMVFNVETQTLTALTEQSSEFSYEIVGETVAYLRDETFRGDLNGDLDSSDAVLHLFDTGSGQITNTNWALATGFSPTAELISLSDGRELGFRVMEFAHGADLNGDGDEIDRVFFVRDLETDAEYSTGLAGALAADDLLQVSESVQGADLNGDGDLDDIVPHVLGSPGNPGVTLPVSQTAARGSATHVAVIVAEVGEQADLNGDGDQLDYVLHAFDRETSVLTNLGLATDLDSGWVISGNLVAIALPEDGTDLNGDMDTSDEVFHLVDLGRGRTWNLGLARGSFVDRPLVSGNVFVVPADEVRQGADLDGSGSIEARTVLFAVQAPVPSPNAHLSERP